MSTDLEEIKNRLNIVDILGQYLRLTKAGTNYRALCPFHNEKSPSFMVSEEKQIWHCFGCQKGGDIFSFVMEMEGLEFYDALKLLAERAGVELKKNAPGTQEKKNRTLEILELATKFYEVQLWKGAGKEKIVSYLKERGLTEETTKLFRLGYAPNGWRNMLEFLTKRGYGALEIAKTGLLVEKTRENSAVDYYDRFRDRIIFPIGDYSGKILGYSARVSPGGDESQAKYVNSPETEVYHKSNVLYGLDKARNDIKQQDFVLLVEGNMDVIAAYQAGIKNVVAVSGTALTPTQLDILKRYTKNIKMLFDMDSAGEAATRKSLKLCFAKEINAQIVELLSGKDAADVARNHPEKLRAAVAASKSAMQYLFDKAFSTYDRSKVEDKKKISVNLLEMLNEFSSEIEKSHWLKKIAGELEVSESVLTGELKKARLGERIPARAQTQVDELGSLADRQKIDILLEELAGLMLILPDYWKDLALKKEYYDYFFRNNLLKLMLERGAEVGFDFGKFSGAIDRESQLLAINLFSRKKFRLGLNNSSEEISVEELQKEAIDVAEAIRSEIKKEKQAKVEKDLKLAEKRGDKMAVKLLQEEFRKILAL
ncbi:MAG: DNA primase [Candidatus Moraniibacteriota bacterium]